MRILSHRLTSAVVAVAVAAGIALSAQAQSVPESQEPIVIALNEWTGQHITAKIAGNILSRMGYHVEYVTAGVFSMAPAIADGQITLGMELWEINLGEIFPSFLADGSIVDAGDVGLDAREGWLYPKYMEQECPGLPAWNAFIECAELFATPETFPDGRFLDYPADWGNRAADLIENEGLPFVAIPAGSEGALVAELRSSVVRQAPLLMMFWAPHWVLFEEETEWVNIPQDLIEKYSMQKSRTFNVAWPKMEEKWPAAWRFINAYKINNDIQEELMGKIDNEGMELDLVIDEWVSNNQSYWQPFVDEALAGS